MSIVKSVLDINPAYAFLIACNKVTLLNGGLFIDGLGETPREEWAVHPPIGYVLVRGGEIIGEWASRPDRRDFPVGERPFKDEWACIAPFNGFSW
jgi:hypothetical protein